MAKRFPENTSVQFSYLPTLRAIAALKAGKPLRAIELLQAAALNELGFPASGFLGFFGALYPVYVRGEAYLALHNGAEAAVEFQKILDHRSVVVSDPVGALAPMQLGRAYTLAGEKDKARSAYRDFLALWKNADPGIPLLRQVKAEYAKL